MRHNQPSRFRNRPCGWLLPGLVVALLTAPATGEENTPSASAEPFVQIDTVRREFQLPESSTLRVVNHLGDVRVRSAEHDQLSVISLIQRFRPDQSDGRVLVEERDGHIDITSRYPSAITGADAQGLAGRVDITLLVPAGALLEIETAAGLIEVRGVARNLKALTKFGRIRVSTRYGVEADSETGALGITLRSASAERPIRLKTRSGEIRVDFPKQPLPGLFAGTRGEIETDGFSQQPKSSPNDEELSILQVGPSPEVIRAESETGRIRLRGLPALELR